MALKPIGGFVAIFHHGFCLQNVEKQYHVKYQNHSI